MSPNKCFSKNILGVKNWKAMVYPCIFLDASISFVILSSRFTTTCCCQCTFSIIQPGAYQVNQNLCLPTIPPVWSLSKVFLLINKSKQIMLLHLSHIHAHRILLSWCPNHLWISIAWLFLFLHASWKFHPLLFLRKPETKCLAFCDHY